MGYFHKSRTTIAVIAIASTLFTTTPARGQYYGLYDTPGAQDTWSYFAGDWGRMNYGAYMSSLNMTMTLMQGQAMMQAVMADNKLSPEQKAQIQREIARKEQLRKQREQKGKVVIQQGKATTKATLNLTPQLEKTLVDALVKEGFDQNGTPQVLRESLSAWTQLAQQNSMDPNDVGDAFSATILMANLVATQNNTTPEQDKAVRDQIRKKLLDFAEFQGTTPAERDETLTALSIGVTLLAMMHQAGQEGGENSDKLREMALKSAREAFPALLGAPVERVRFTTKGFEILPETKKTPQNQQQ